MIKHVWNKEGYIDVLWVDEISLADIIQYFKELQEDKNYPYKNRRLITAVNCIIKFEITEVVKINNARNKMLKDIDDSYITAIVTSKPIETTFSTMYGEISNSENYMFKVFRAYYEAKKWIKHTIRYDGR